MRLGDLDALNQEVEKSLCKNPHTGVVAQAMHTHEHKHFLCMIAQQPTIEPESVPVVRELRKQLAKVTAERDAAVSFIPKIRDTCKYKDTPCDWYMYDPDGLDNWEWDGLPKQKTGSTDAQS